MSNKYPPGALHELSTVAALLQGSKSLPHVTNGRSCFATLNLKLRKIKELYFSLFLNNYVNSGQRLNYLYINVYFPRRRLHEICAFEKRQNSLWHEMYSLKYTQSDKTNGL